MTGQSPAMGIGQGFAHPPGIVSGAQYKSDKALGHNLTFGDRGNYFIYLLIKLMLIHFTLPLIYILCTILLPEDIIRRAFKPAPGIILMGDRIELKNHYRSNHLMIIMLYHRRIPVHWQNQIEPGVLPPLISFSPHPEYQEISCHRASLLNGFHILWHPAYYG